MIVVPLILDNVELKNLFSGLRAFELMPGLPWLSLHPGATLKQSKSPEMSPGVKSEDEESVLCSRAPPEGHGRSHL